MPRLKKTSKPLMPISTRPTLPKSFAGERSSDDPPPYVGYEYKPPSILAEHKVLALVFGVLFLALALYCYFAVYKPLEYPPPPRPVYIDAVPQSAAEPAAPP